MFLSKNRSNLESNISKIAVIFGRAMSINGKITTAFVNKQLAILDIDKVNSSEVKQYFSTVIEDKELTTIYEEAFNGGYTLDDLSAISEKENGVGESSLASLTSPSVTDTHVIRGTLNEYRKLQRELSAQAHLSSQIVDSVLDAMEGVLSGSGMKVELTIPKTSKERTAVITPADWHIGAVIDNITENKYDYAIFRDRLDQYIDRCLEYIEEFKCTSVLIVHLGDIVEGIDMRKINQPFEAEFNASKQLGLAIDSMLHLINRLSVCGLPISVGGVGGNHDRYTSNKKEAIYGDSIMYNIVNFLLLLEEREALPSTVTVLDNTDSIYTLEVDIAGQASMFTHGDGEKRIDSSRISKFIKEYPISNIWFGHFHSNLHSQEDYDRMSYMAGSIMGANSYSKQIGAPSTKASQLITIISEVEDIGVSEKFAIPIFFSI